VLEIVELLLALPTADKKENKKQKMLVESRGLKCATLWQAAFCLLLFCFHYTHFAAQLELYKYCKLILNGRRRGAVSFASC